MPKPRPAFLLLLCVSPFLTPGAAKNNDLYREYIGALFKNVTFSDVPINPHVQFHFILSFAIDYTNLTSPLPTNGKFGIFWDASNLSPAHVLAIKKRHPNVKVAVSIGGDSVGGLPAYFNITTEDSWVSNAVQSLTKIIEVYHLDGVDVDYEHFRADPQTFARCVGRLIQTLKATKTISSASIAPYDDNPVQNHYLALWKSYGHLIDFVNFQFYAYDNSTTVRQFLGYYRNQTLNYKGGKVLVSFESDEQRGLTPKTGFFVACEKLKKRGQLYGIFAWCADASKPQGFFSEIRSQNLLAQL